MALKSPEFHASTLALVIVLTSEAILFTSAADIGSRVGTSDTLAQAVRAAIGITTYSIMRNVLRITIPPFDLGILPNHSSKSMLFVLQKV